MPLSFLTFLVTTAQPVDPTPTGYNYNMHHQNAYAQQMINMGNMNMVGNSYHMNNGYHGSSQNNHAVSRFDFFFFFFDVDIITKKRGKLWSYV